MPHTLSLSYPPLLISCELMLEENLWELEIVCSSAPLPGLYPWRALHFMPNPSKARKIWLANITLSALIDWSIVIVFIRVVVWSLNSNMLPIKEYTIDSDLVRNFLLMSGQYNPARKSADGKCSTNNCQIYFIARFLLSSEEISVSNEKFKYAVLCILHFNSW